VRAPDDALTPGQSPLNRRGKVEEAAASIVMLASPLASCACARMPCRTSIHALADVTGITLEVAGGRLL
jgi:hypothetical protein